TELQHAIVDAYYKDPSGSLTSALRRLLQDVNESVYAENDRSMPSDRSYASIGCAVFRDDDIYVAIVGSVLCFGVAGTAFERLGRSRNDDGDRAVDRIGQV